MIAKLLQGLGLVLLSACAYMPQERVSTGETTVGIKVCTSGSGATVARVNLDYAVPNVMYKTYSGQATQTVEQIFNGNKYPLSKSMLVVNANFFVNRDNSDYPRNTPIGRAYNQGFAHKSPNKHGVNGVPDKINGQSNTTPDTLAFYFNSTEGFRAAVVNASDWTTWYTANPHLKSAVSGIQIYDIQETPRYMTGKAKRADINYSGQRERTAIGVAENQRNILYVVTIDNSYKQKTVGGKKVGGIAIKRTKNSDVTYPLADYVRSAPHACGDDGTDIGEIINLDGGKSATLFARGTDATVYKSRPSGGASGTYRPVPLALGFTGRTRSVNSTSFANPYYMIKNNTLSGSTANKWLAGYQAGTTKDFRLANFDFPLNLYFNYHWAFLVGPVTGETNTFSLSLNSVFGWNGGIDYIGTTQSGDDYAVTLNHTGTYAPNTSSTNEWVISQRTDGFTGMQNVASGTWLKGSDDGTVGLTENESDTGAGWSFFPLMFWPQGTSTAQ